MRYPFDVFMLIGHRIVPVNEYQLAFIVMGQNLTTLKTGTSPVCRMGSVAKPRRTGLRKHSSRFMACQRFYFVVKSYEYYARFATI